MSWLSLFLFLVMVGVIYFQSLHGMFGSMIMATLCVVCATLALGIHETVAEDLLYDLIGDYAYGVSFVGIFSVSLIALRVLLDKITPRSAILPALIDKIGASAFAIVTGFVTAGVLATGLQMAPLGSKILGFERIDEQGEEHNLWLSPDKFTVSLCSHLAGATLGGEESWGRGHPDFLTELHWFRNTPSTGSRICLGGQGDVRVTSMWTTKKLHSVKESDRRRGKPTVKEIPGPPAGKQWFGVSVSIGPKGTDSDGKFRASATQVRLVGESGEITEQYPLKAVGLSSVPVYVTADSLDTWGGKSGKFDLVFEIPTGFSPRFVEYKRAGRALVSIAGDPTKRLKDQTAEGVAVAVADKPASSRGGSRSGGSSGAATNPVRPAAVNTHFGNKLPLTIKRYAGTSVQTGGDGDALVEGLLALYVEKQDADDEKQGRRGSRRGGRGRGNENIDPEKTPIKSFLVPSELRMLQLNIEAIHANTALAGAVNLTRRVLQQYRVIDKGGETYWPAGLIVECDSGGERVMEIQYFPEEAWLRSQIRPFERVKFADLKGDYQFVLLFMVPPGTEIVKFDSGKAPVDLSDQNLTAPR